MPWLARLLFFVPSIVAGWLLAEGDHRFWVVTLAIALLMIAGGAVLYLYAPRLRGWWTGRD